MKSKIIFGQMINYYRKLNNMSMEEFGNKIGKTKSTISKWESSNRYPKIEEVETIADLFGVSVETLLFGANTNKDELVEIYNKLTHPRQAKVYNFAEQQLNEQNNILKFDDHVQEEMIGYISAGTGEFLTDDISEEVLIPRENVPDTDYDMVLKVNGDSMQPMFKNKEYVFVKKTEEIRNGQVGVFIIDGESYLKKAYIENSHLRLVSLNPTYDDLIFNDYNEIKIIGKVVL